MSFNEARKLRCNGIYGTMLSYIFSLLIYRGYSKHIISFHKINFFAKNNITAYYIAKASYLNGRYHNAKTILQDLKKRVPEHAETTYLLSDLLLRLGDEKGAWHILEKLLLISKRGKTWLKLANLVSTPDKYKELESLWQKHICKDKSLCTNAELYGYIATAALRSKKYDSAISIWEEILQKTISKELKVFKNNKSIFSSIAANDALLDLKIILDNEKISFFLISGTLLGCIRNGELLGHDKDIDIGVWSDVDQSKLINSISTSGLFEINAARSKHSIRIKHVNGISIDIFLHYRESNNYWHGGVKLKWNNTPFELVKHTFLGKEFFIPKDYHLYLKENYGNWQEEKKDFDSAYDTPNSEIISIHEMKVHTLKKLAIAYSYEYAPEIEKLNLELKLLFEFDKEKNHQ